MSDKDKQLLRERLGLAKDIAAVVGPVLVGCLLLWLKSEFVTRSEYMETDKRLDKVESALMLLVEQQKTYARLDERDRDFELRLRALEQARH